MNDEEKISDRLINVLIVDDSTVARMAVAHLLESDPQIKVIGIVGDGQAALDFIQETPPDVVLMDIHMPGMDGLEATRRIMETRPVPIVICSATIDPTEVTMAFRLMEAGAVACVEKPIGQARTDSDVTVARFLSTVKLMSEVKVVRHWPVRTSPFATPVSHPRRINAPSTGVKLIGMAASTGGPPVLQTVLSGLPKSFPVPILIVQHIAPGFLPGLADWLCKTIGINVHIAEHDVAPLPGHVYLAPDACHMGVSANGRIHLTNGVAENGPRPAAGYLFRSVAEAYGPDAVGVLLSGMGKDGAAELKLMKDYGATTIAQDRESSTVHGMPGEAIALGGATHVLTPERIAKVLTALVMGRDTRATRD